MSPRKLLLNLFLASIAVNASLGIWALLVDDFGETQGKILASSFLVSAAMLSALINAPAIGRRVRWPAPLAGAVAGAAGFSLFIVLLWVEPDGESWFKLAGSLLVVAGAATLAGSLAMVGLADRFIVLERITDALIALLAATILITIWGEVDEDWMGRLIGVEAVLVAAFTLAIPAVARFGGPAGRPPATGPPAIRFCPACGNPVTERPLGTGVVGSCGRCGLIFDVVAGMSSNRSADPADRWEERPLALRGSRSSREADSEVTR